MSKIDTNTEWTGSGSSGLAVAAVVAFLISAIIVLVAGYHYREQAHRHYVDRARIQAIAGGCL